MATRKFLFMSTSGYSEQQSAADDIVLGALAVTNAATLGSAVITNGATVGTTLAVSGATTLAAVTASGAAILQSTLAVTGAATMASTLAVTGASTLGVLGAGASTLASAVVSGAATVGSTLGVTGTSTLGVLSAGASTLSSATISNGATVGTTLAVTGATTMAALTASGAAQINSTLGVTGASSIAALTASGAAILQSTLAVTGAATMASTLGLTGSLTMGAAGNVIIPLAPSADTHAANKLYVDGLISTATTDRALIRTEMSALVQGIDIKYSVRAATTANITLSGAQSIDGVSVVAGNRVLVKDQTLPAANGIYVAAAGAWSRSDDMSISAECVGAFCFIEEGTVNADGGWVMSSNDTFVLATTAMVWTQFSNAGVILAGAGLTKSGVTIDIGAGSGIAVAADSIAIDLADDPGLQFSSSKLDLKLLSTGGLQKGSTGASIKIASANQLASDASGLAVTGVPSLFKINGSAVSAAVSHTNLGLLTDAAHYQTAGGVNALHQHMSVPTAQSRYTASAAAISAGDPICVASATTVKKGAANVDASALVFGVAQASVSASGTCEVVSHGYVPSVLSSATAGTAYYLAASGGLSADLPGAGNRVVRMGFALNTTDLFVVIADLGKQAA